MNEPTESSVCRHIFTVPADALDGNGHVNNVVYVQWMQDMAIRHADTCGCTAATLEVGATWVARSHSIEYLRPALANDQIEAQTWVADFRRVRSMRRYRFLRLPEKKLLAQGETDWVFVDAKTGRPRNIPASIKSLFPPV